MHSSGTSGLRLRRPLAQLDSISTPESSKGVVFFAPLEIPQCVPHKIQSHCINEIPAKNSSTGRNQAAICSNSNAQMRGNLEEGAVSILQVLDQKLDSVQTLPFARIRRN